MTVEETALALVKKLDQVNNSPEYIHVWELFRVHGMEYLGPNYIDELKDLKKTLRIKNDET